MGGVGHLCTCARAPPSLYLRIRVANCAKIWCVARDPIVTRFTRAGGGVNTFARACPVSLSRIPLIPGIKATPKTDLSLSRSLVPRQIWRLTGIVFPKFKFQSYKYFHLWGLRFSFHSIALFQQRQLNRSCFVWIGQITRQSYSPFLKLTTTKPNRTGAAYLGFRSAVGAWVENRVWNGLDQSAGFIIQSSPGGCGLNWIRNSPTQRILDWTGSRNVQCVSHI